MRRNLLNIFCAFVFGVGMVLLFIALYDGLTILKIGVDGS